MNIFPQKVNDTPLARSVKSELLEVINELKNKESNIIGEIEKIRREAKLEIEKLKPSLVATIDRIAILEKCIIKINEDADFE